ncbi:hypothetical protein FE810_12925 [Thalassotalea litorea]|uniref:Uncharacterized protein n=1 Tax=Thalassotalea litorea TaxID=2020715 RepID=A0A5R9IQN3_9GAMM|nr:hypothetical protein [Thalassotalea litorea]TLU64198.1 hypothetical protein FE810_12925 [Thalassotalea litorea]
MDHENIGQLLGFIVAHSASIGDELKERELMVPFVISVLDNHPTVIDFEAETQEMAVNNAEAKLAELSLSADAWSYAQDGMVTMDDGSEQDVYFYKVWLNGMVEPLLAYQMYQKYPFKLKGNVQILNYVEAGLSPDLQEPLINGLNVGISSHDTANQKWDSWSQ